MTESEKPPADPYSLPELVQMLEDGVLPCKTCGEPVKIEHFDPLQMAKCPSCSDFHFMPLHVGHFWLTQPLGGGGMGSVYKACSVKMPDKWFAVKILAREHRNDPLHISALQNEGRIAAAVGRHPYLVTCIEHGYEDGEYYYAMEYIQGRRLDRKIQQEGTLPERQALNLALQILSAETHIFQHGFLYRDLKPENIIISSQGHAILLDYGLCGSLEQSRNPEPSDYVSGSPYYIPPERIWGTAEDAYSDIYSLGMVLYYALTSRTYYDADEVESLARRHIARVRLIAASKMRGLSPGLVEVLSKMIKQNSEERFQSFSSCAKAIQKLMDS